MVAWSKFQGELAQQCQNVASIYMYLLLHKVNFVVMWMTVNFGALKRIHDWNRVVLLRYIIAIHSDCLVSDVTCFLAHGRLWWLENHIGFCKSEVR